jgi:probable HAF family extracellular repeat protein
MHVQERIEKEGIHTCRSGAQPNLTNRSGVVLAIVALVCGAAPLLAQGRFTRLGTPNTFPKDISADGRIVVGTRSNFGPAFRWTEAEGVVNIGGDGFQAKISRDGKTIVSNAKDAQGLSSAAIWLGGTNWRTLGGIPGGQSTDGKWSTAYSVSADGSVIVGLAWFTTKFAHPFRWDAKTGMVDLGALQQRSARASVVSADGNVIAGWDEDPSAYNHNQWRGAMWWQGLERLLHPFGWIGEALGINESGSVIVGTGHPATTGHAYRFTAWDGQVEDLGAIERGLTEAQRQQEDTSIAFGVSDDGTVVVGISGWKSPTDAVIWTPETRMVKLKDYMTGKGITGHERWLLAEAIAVTPDGKSITGTGFNPEGLAEGFVVTLP